MRRTPYDDHEIIQARELANALPKTIDDHSMRRQLLRNRIALQYYNNGAKRKERVAVIITGPPGAGKSTLTSPLLEWFGAFLVDTNEAMSLIPEYREIGGISSVSLISEASHIAKGLVLPRVIQEGDNFVMPIIGDDPVALSDMALVLKEADYETHLVLVHVNRDIATKRIIRRFRQTGRFVDTVYVYEQVGYKPLQAYNEVRELGVFDTYAAYQNENPMGHPPTCIDASPGSPVSQALGFGSH